MACTSCGSDKQAEFGAEINLHRPGLKGIDQSPVCAFPKLTVCLDCGHTEFTVPKDQLRHLTTGAAA
jgi:hypothetical protein